jgi:hypothetical protein
MPGLYDHLKDQLGNDDENQPTGLTPLDIADLPDAQRQVMFALLRDNRSSANGLSADLLREKLPGAEGLAAVLDELTLNSWLIRLGEAPNVRYKVNLRRKRGSSLGGGLWSSLSRLLAEEDSSQDTDSPDRPSLSDW